MSPVHDIDRDADRVIGAAMQAFKMFQGQSGGSSNSSGGGQSQMISMAMQEASKLFDNQNSQGNVSSKFRSTESCYVILTTSQAVLTNNLRSLQQANSQCRCI